MISIFLLCRVYRFSHAFFHYPPKKCQPDFLEHQIKGDKNAKIYSTELIWDDFNPNAARLRGKNRRKIGLWFRFTT
jgi:hypothetical protein